MVELQELQEVWHQMAEEEGVAHQVQEAEEEEPVQDLVVEEVEGHHPSWGVEVVEEVHLVLAVLVEQEEEEELLQVLQV